MNVPFRRVSAVGEVTVGVLVLVPWVWLALTGSFPRSLLVALIVTAAVQFGGFAVAVGARKIRKRWHARG